MKSAALEGRDLVRGVDDLRTLLVSGEVASKVLPALAAPPDVALWFQSGDQVIATPHLLDLANALPNYNETLSAVFSLIPTLRKTWLRVILARLQSTAERNDLAGLCEAITASSKLAAELVADVAPSLNPTSFGELERLVLAAPAHEAQSYPILLRVLSATAAFAAAPTKSSSSSIQNIDWSNPSTTWQPGRLIRLPSIDDSAPASVVLTGALDDRVANGDPMRWVLQRPWAFLLSQMVFTKEAWEAERISGGMAFELDPAHSALFQRPPRVEIVVTLPSGEEVPCGSLAEFVLQVLAQLEVTILAHRLSPAALDARLADVIDALVRHEVWRFDHGTGGRRAGYTIHPLFSDSCYRALGSRAFYRLGSSVTAAIRRVAETWARERVARAGTQIPVEVAT